MRKSRYLLCDYSHLMVFDKNLVSGYGDYSIPPDEVYTVRLIHDSPAESIKVINE